MHRIAASIVSLNFTVKKSSKESCRPILTLTSSGLDHPSPSFHVSFTCEFVDRNSNPKSSQGVSILAVPGSFFAVSVDICSLLLLIILMLLPSPLPIDTGWKASENETVASSAVSMDLLSKNIFLFFFYTRDSEVCLFLDHNLDTACN